MIIKTITVQTNWGMPDFTVDAFQFESLEEAQATLDADKLLRWINWSYKQDQISNSIKEWAKRPSDK